MAPLSAMVLQMHSLHAWPLDLLQTDGPDAPTDRFIKYTPGEECTSAQMADKPDLEIECKCPAEKEDYCMKAEEGSSGQTCGGIPMRKGYCVVPKDGTFSRVDQSQVSPGLRLRKTAAEPFTAYSPWCQNDTDATDGSFVGKGNVNEQGKYEGADGEWNTRLCRSLPLDQDALLKGFPEKRILMIGDSHVRNVFTALVSGVREEEFFAEAHGYHAVFQYSVGARRDRWRLVDPESFPGLKLLTEQERVAIAEIQFDSGPPFTPCTELDLGSPCVDIVFVWAPTFREQLAYTKPLMEAVAPEVVLASVSSWEKTRVMDTAWEHMWDGVFDNYMLDSFLFMMWPYGNPLALEREVEVRSWLAKKERPFRASFVNMEMVFKKVHSLQLHHVWHDVCVLRDSFPKDMYSIEAYEPCTASPSRALARVWLTLARPLDAEEGSSSSRAGPEATTTPEDDALPPQPDDQTTNPASDEGSPLDASTSETSVGVEAQASDDSSVSPERLSVSEEEIMASDGEPASSGDDASAESLPEEADGLADPNIDPSPDAGSQSDTLKDEAEDSVTAGAHAGDPLGKETATFSSGSVAESAAQRDHIRKGLQDVKTPPGRNVVEERSGDSAVDEPEVAVNVDTEPDLPAETPIESEGENRPADGLTSMDKVQDAGTTSKLSKTEPELGAEISPDDATASVIDSALEPESSETKQFLYEGAPVLQQRTSPDGKPSVIDASTSQTEDIAARRSRRMLQDYV